MHVTVHTSALAHVLLAADCCYTVYYFLPPFSRAQLKALTVSALVSTNNGPAPESLVDSFYSWSSYRHDEWLCFFHVVTVEFFSFFFSFCSEHSQTRKSFRTDSL